MEQQNLEAIEQYLTGKLSKEETEAFEQLLETDEQFKIQFEQTKMLILGIQYSGKVNTLNRLKQLESSLPEIKTRPEPTILRYLDKYKYWAAASILLIILSALFFISKNGQKTDCKALYEAYFEPYPNIVYPTTRFDKPSLTLIQKAFIEYDKKHYSNAISLFKSIPNYNSNQTIIFYLAMAHMGNNDTRQATPLFLSILGQNPTLEDKIKWYLGLCYLKNNNTTTAKLYFNDLAETNNSYAQKAIRILKKIK